jgi:hypothetical protein
MGIRHTDHVASSIRKKVGNHFADKRRSLGRYSLLADSDHGIFSFTAINLVRNVFHYPYFKYFSTSISKIHIGKYLSENVPIQNNLKQADALLPLLGKFCFRICN